MTPQLQQAIRLLQLSSLELQAEIQEVMETNPLLEVEEDFEFNDNAATDKTEEQQIAAETPDASQLENTNIPEELPTDSQWEDTFEQPTGPAAPSNQISTPGIARDNEDSSSDSLQPVHSCTDNQITLGRGAFVRAWAMAEAAIGCNANNDAMYEQ